MRRCPYFSLFMKTKKREKTYPSLIVMNDCGTSYYGNYIIAFSWVLIKVFRKFGIIIIWIMPTIIWYIQIIRYIFFRKSTWFHKNLQYYLHSLLISNKNLILPADQLVNRPCVCYLFYKEWMPYSDIASYTISSAHVLLHVCIQNTNA